MLSCWNVILKGWLWFSICTDVLFRDPCKELPNEPLVLTSESLCCLPVWVSNNYPLRDIRKLWTSAIPFNVTDIYIVSCFPVLKYNKTSYRCLVSLEKKLEKHLPSLEVQGLGRPRKSQAKHVCSVVSSSFRPCGLQPARLLCPWDFPDKNNGAGFHFLLQGILPT